MGANPFIRSIFVLRLKTIKNKTPTTMKPNFTQVSESINEWIEEVNFDLKQDWNEDKESMFIQLQSLLIIKANLENIEILGGQIFRSSIKK